MLISKDVEDSIERYIFLPNVDLWSYTVPARTPRTQYLRICLASSLSVPLMKIHFDENRGIRFTNPVFNPRIDLLKLEVKARVIIPFPLQCTVGCEKRSSARSENAVVRLFHSRRRFLHRRCGVLCKTGSRVASSGRRLRRHRSWQNRELSLCDES